MLRFDFSLFLRLFFGVSVILFHFISILFILNWSSACTIRIHLSSICVARTLELCNLQCNASIYRKPQRSHLFLYFFRFSLLSFDFVFFSSFFITICCCHCYCSAGYFQIHVVHICQAAIKRRFDKYLYNETSYSM